VARTKTVSRARLGVGREDSSPALLQFGVLGAVAALVLVILVVAMVVWATLR
jgi:hypothetical protein